MAFDADQVERALRLTCSERSAADEATVLSWAKRVKIPEEVVLEQLVASMEMREYNAVHSVLFRQGDEGDSYYLVLSGEVGMFDEIETTLGAAIFLQSRIKGRMVPTATVATAAAAAATATATATATAIATDTDTATATATTTVTATATTTATATATATAAATAAVTAAARRRCRRRLPIARRPAPPPPPATTPHPSCTHAPPPLLHLSSHTGAPQVQLRRKTSPRKQRCRQEPTSPRPTAHTSRLTPHAPRPPRPRPLRTV